MRLFSLIILLTFVSCLSQDLINLASQYTGSITFFESAQRDLRLVNSQCNYETECFEREGLAHIERQFCPQYEDHNFVSETKCMKAGQGVIDLMTGKKSLAVPIRNPTQDSHNDRMYSEIEKAEKFEFCKIRRCYLKTLPTKSLLEACENFECYTIYDKSRQYTKELLAIEEYKAKDRAKRKANRQQAQSDRQREADRQAEQRLRDLQIRELQQRQTELDRQSEVES